MISVLLSWSCRNYISAGIFNQPYQVCLLESGGLDFDEVSQSLYTGENIGPYCPLNEARARYLGGSTNLWEDGVTLDDIDFEDRPAFIVAGPSPKQS